MIMTRNGRPPTNPPILLPKRSPAIVVVHTTAPPTMPPSSSFATNGSMSMPRKSSASQETWLDKPLRHELLAQSIGDEHTSGFMGDADRRPCVGNRDLGSGAAGPEDR